MVLVVALETLRHPSTSLMSLTWLVNECHPNVFSLSLLLLLVFPRLPTQGSSISNLLLGTGETPHACDMQDLGRNGYDQATMYDTEE